MNFQSNTIQIPTIFFEWAKYISAQEFLIICLVFKNKTLPKQSILDFVNNSEKSIDSLVKQNILQESREGYFVSDNPNFKNYEKKVKQEKIEVEVRVKPVESWESFLPNVKFNEDQKRISYLIFKYAGFDLTNPYSYITDFDDWKKSCSVLARLLEGKFWLIEQAINYLKEKKLYVTGPRSLFKTVVSMKSESINPPKIEEEVNISSW